MHRMSSKIAFKKPYFPQIMNKKRGCLKFTFEAACLDFFKGNQI